MAGKASRGTKAKREEKATMETKDSEDHKAQWAVTASRVLLDHPASQVPEETAVQSETLVVKALWDQKELQVQLVPV